jgi:cell division inhibitor SepF
MMSMNESLRKAVGYFDGGSRDEDEGYDSYGEYDERPDEHNGTGKLALLQPAARGFFLAAPHVFDDVQEIGSRLKSDTPVIVDLHDCGAGLTERIVDFCSGLAYALDGGVHRIGQKILLLTPNCVDLSSEGGVDTFRHGFFDQT